MIRKILSIAIALGLGACQTNAPPPAPAQAGTTASQAGTPADSVPAAAAPAQAPLFNNLGTYTRAVTTQSEQAQRYFSQGMVLTYGFNHAEAGRAFREAARLDPQCAACWWGAALVLGPNVNLPMMDTDVADAYATSRKALALIDNETPLERALIQALATRYAETPGADRSALDLAYANAMRDVARQFPDNPDVLALFAESILDLSPWDYYLPGGKPKPTTAEAVQALEHAIALSPDHPGALHYYIHAVEASEPERAVTAADRLWHLVPGAGHLVHMPAHIYMRVGRYHDAVLTNQEATAADKSYIEACNVQGFYPLAYYSHNWHFIWAGSMSEGNGQLALEGASQTHHVLHGAPLDDPAFGPTLQHLTLAPTFAATRFARWDSVDALPMPDAKLIYPVAMWHQARGSALAARGDLPGAERELAQVRQALTDPQLKKMYISRLNNTHQIVSIAERVLTADIAARRKQYPAAIAALETALQVEDSLGYNEPEDWPNPVRLTLGAVLLDAGRPVAAEAAFRGDLKKHPENGWALFGLAQSLRAQQKTAAANEVQARFDKAWVYADTKLTAAVIR